MAGAASGPGAQEAGAASLREVVRATVSALRKAGVDNPTLEARLLVEHALGVDRVLQLRDPDRPVPSAERAVLGRLVRRRAEREPLAYVLGRREFWGRSFVVAPGVLIPRPETETLIEAALAYARTREPALRLADLGTGSGCILLTLLAELPSAVGVGTDLAPAAVSLARANAVRLGLAGRCLVVRADWAAPLGDGFDLLVANPPYVASGEIAALAPEVARFEPRLALDGGSDGLAPYRALTPTLRRCLRPHGRAFLEIGRDQEQALRPWFELHGLAPALHRDLAGIVRVLELSRAGEREGARGGAFANLRVAGMRSHDTARERSSAMAIDHHAALIYTMVLVSAAEGQMTDAEITTMTRLVSTLPVFDGFDRSRIDELGQACAELLRRDDGLDVAIDMIGEALPAKLRETAYALACDVAAADGSATQNELRLLEMLRYRLDVERLTAAAIERGAQARHRRA